MRRTTTTILATTALLLTTIGPLSMTSADAAAGTPRCHGLKATIVGNGKANKINGTKKRDIIVAGAGNDTIHGRGGNDVICTGSGRDVAYGDGGKDTIYTNTGTAQGGPGDDKLIKSKPSKATFILDGGPGNDSIRGGTGSDRMYGGPGNDKFTDLAGHNQVSDTAGTSVIRLGSGNDFVEVAGRHNDIVTGGGNDTLIATGDISTGSGNDFIAYQDCVGCPDDDVFDIELGPGIDSITMGPSDGVPVPGSNSATADFNLDGGTGDDTLSDSVRPGGTGTTTVVLGTTGSLAGPWNATLMGFENYNSFEGINPQTFDVTGSGDPNTITVFGVNSTIEGLGGNDVLSGDGGNIDTIDGGNGTDDACFDADTYLNCEETD